jgi:copper chaperone NosL
VSPLKDKLLNPRVLVGVAALLLLLVYHTPLWSIHLVAPQYRDGLGMYISINEVRGHDTHDLQNINILNHYIGMQEIDPEGIPELEIMPMILGILIAAGILAALIGNRWIMGLWLLAFIVAGIAGMVDFYMWKYDYGHNLNPDAPIKVPGMTYQPPLIGTKQLLNIKASSWPYWGTGIIALSVLLGSLGVWRAFRRDGRDETPTGAKRPEGTDAPSGEPVRPESDSPTPSEAPVSSSALRTVAVAILASLLVACGSPDDGDLPRQTAGAGTADVMVYGEDVDPFCGHEVDRVRWGGELRTTSDERVRFRSVECMAGYLLAGKVEPDRVASVKVVDFPDGWRLVDASDAVFLHTPNLASPDRLNLLAIDRENERMIRNLQDAYTGPLIGWEQVLELVEERWQPAVDAGGCQAALGSEAPVCG